MQITTVLRQAWRAFFQLRKRRSEPVWARVSIATALAIALWSIGVGLCAVGILKVETDNIALWRFLFGGSIVLFLSIAYGFLALAYLLEWTLPAWLIDIVSPARDWRGAALMSALAIGGAMLGQFMGLRLSALIFHYDLSKIFESLPRTALSFLKLLLVIATINAIFWQLRLKRQLLEQQATRAQLLLLQAQIEPHFLFNTLANVQSLMDHDPPRAKQMLESFTDYLRANLGQLRHPDSTLAAELELVERYLELLRIRMGDRLDFSITASDQARSCQLPVLLLQPLIENAIHHGLEPKIEGGYVRVRANVLAGRLCIEVEDDGLGIDGPRRAIRTGHGMALANLRTRLHTRYADDAELTLTAQAVGTLVELKLPFQAPA
jgi:sensor histidine kinase YesM